MKVFHNFSVPIPESIARERLTAFMAHAGYELASDKGRLIFKRGSFAGTLSSFNPLNWACTASAALTARGDNITELNILYAITNDPFEGHFARELLAAEGKSLEAALSQKEVVAFDVSDLTHRIAANVYRVTGSLLGLIHRVCGGICRDLFL